MATLLLVTAGTGSGCGLFTDEGSLHIVRVDSISAPAALSPSEVLELRFFGMVGSDQCSRLSLVEKTTTSNQLTIRFLAERPGGHCLQMPVMLEYAETIAPPLTDPFTITVLQPSGQRLIHSVRIE